MIVLFFLLSIYFPIIYYNSVNLNPDFLIIAIVYLGFTYNRKVIIIISFILGLVQDFLIQYEYLGISSILVISFGYAIGNIKKIKEVNLKYTFIIISVLIYFYFIESITSYSNIFLNTKTALIKTFITITTYFIIRYIFKKRFIKIEKQ